MWASNGGIGINYSRAGRMGHFKCGQSIALKHGAMTEKLKLHWLLGGIEGDETAKVVPSIIVRSPSRPSTTAA
jgi:hypothetical protein